MLNSRLIQLPLQVALPATCALDHFYAGGNQSLLAAITECLSGGSNRFLYLCGMPGCGKTHLLMGATHQARAQGLTAVYLPLGGHDDLQPEVFDALEQFDLLCLDDIDAVIGIPAWEFALFALFNGIQLSGSRLLVAAQIGPYELPTQLADLKSRLCSGLLLRFQELSDLDKMAALVRKASVTGLEVPESVARYLLHHCERDLASLWALLDRLDRASLTAQRRLTVPFVKSVLAQSL